MRILWLMLVLSLKSKMALKIDALGSIAITIINYGLKLFFFDIVFSYTSSIGVYEMKHIVGLLFVSILLDFFIAIFYPSIKTFFYKAYKGEVEPFFTKPIPISFIIFFRFSNPIKIFFFIILSIILFFIFPFIEVSFLILGVATFFLSCIAHISFLLLCESFVFLLKRPIPIDFMYVELMRLNILTPSLYGSFIHVLFFYEFTLWISYSVGCALLIVLSISIFYFLKKRFESAGG